MDLHYIAALACYGHAELGDLANLAVLACMLQDVELSLVELVAPIEACP